MWKRNRLAELLASSPTLPTCKQVDYQNCNIFQYLLSHPPFLPANKLIIRTAMYLNGSHLLVHFPIIVFRSVALSKKALRNC